MIKVSNGNKKIGKDTLIINMNSATDCPSRKLGLCNIDEGKCYALKAERIYPQVLPYRRKQESLWDHLMPSELAQGLNGIIKRKRNKIKYIRFSEAGDFKSQWDVDKMKNLARIIPEVSFYGYTARRDLDFSGLPDNLVVNGSGFMVSNMFTATREISDQEVHCPGDCRECGLCKEARGLDIKVLYH